MKEKCGVLLIVLIVGVLVFADNIVSADQKPTTVAELALYKGPDRQQILEEGARKEGKCILYTSGIISASVREVVGAFQKKYPYIKVDIWRASSPKLISRTREEYKSGKYTHDILESSLNAQIVSREIGISQPYYSPNLTNIREGAITKAPSGGVFSASFRMNDVGLGYNTNLISKEELPKTYQDLLDPKWEGKLTIAASGTSINWMATMLEAYGEEFVEKIAKQNFILHSISARALLDLIIAGEYSFSPAAYCPEVKQSKKIGAPIDWIYLEPVYVSITQVSLPKHAPHPHAALLYIDHQLSKEGAEVQEANFYLSSRKDAPSATTSKIFYGAKSAKQVKEWSELFNKLFLKH
ncbi:ABC transporter substrate-binding protein [Thermodesulfobacteriota bacterium]